MVSSLNASAYPLSRSNHARLYTIFTRVLKEKKEEKLEAAERKFREELGRKPYELRQPLG